MPLGQSQDIPQTDPRGVATPRFWHRLIRFRHVISGSLALASLNHTCRNLVPTFPQRSPPSLLTTAACGGLRSTPDCRPRRALLHLSYSCAPPCGPAVLLTQHPTSDISGPLINSFCSHRHNRSLPQMWYHLPTTSLLPRRLHAEAGIHHAHWRCGRGSSSSAQTSTRRGFTKTPTPCCFRRRNAKRIPHFLYGRDARARLR